MNHPLMRYHGGKWRLAEKIIRYFPPHRTYVEPFGGSAAVLCRKPRSKFEVYNDLDSEIVNVFRVLRDPGRAARLAELCALTPYARDEFELAYEDTEDPVESARRTLFRATAGFGSASATKGRSGFRSYSGSSSSRGGVTRGPNPSHNWSRMPAAIEVFAERLSGVLIENKDALEIIRAYDSPETLFYLDPPYHHDTRSIGGGRYYRHEMSADEHSALLSVIADLQSSIVISGYAHDHYDSVLKGWERVEFSAQASGRFGSVQRTEVIWINPDAWSVLSSDLLFSEMSA